jgi:hypothetical protein
MTVRRILLLLSLLTFGLDPGLGQAQPVDQVDLGARCERLKGTDFSEVQDAPTQVTATLFIDPTADLPRHCEVFGYVSPNVRFELRLPSSWNGKFMEIGCGGHCGFLLEGLAASNCDASLRRGYACLATDMGHSGTGSDGIWAVGNLQARVDWGFRATHVVVLAGKAITGHYYAHPPKRSFFMGCSTGGRQGLQEAQHFPSDFDGIIAGAPPTHLSALYMDAAWSAKAIRDADGKLLLAADDLKRVAAAAVAKCDLDDGVRDGVIGNPFRCKFDPGELACQSAGKDWCLKPPQLDAVRKLYTGSRNSQGKNLTAGGLLPGSEDFAARIYIPTDDHPSSDGLIENGLRDLFFWPEAGPGWTLKQFDFDRDDKRMGSMEVLVDAGNPDLRPFKAAGGKLIVFQGLNDAEIARSTVDYYETVERTMGGRKMTEDFFRLFVLPGVNHCSGGVGADAADFLGSIEAWVEEGKAPDRILSAHVAATSSSFAYPYREFPKDAKAVQFSRPVYPYPIEARYKGRGDPSDAANFIAISR